MKKYFKSSISHLTTYKKQMVDWGESDKFLLVLLLQKLKSIKSQIEKSSKDIL
jgi:hypothetical protein